ncbi:MAG: ATP-dependent nuclease [Limisphaerales bacterium]
MITIRDIEISRFRSIRDAKLADLQDFSVLAGLNNSGKSNFLRALNLFFTGRPEPELPFNLTRDYYRGELSAKKKKNIRISVHFTLPKSFRFRGGLKPVEDLLGRDFAITKEWAFRQTDTTVYLKGSIAPLPPDDVVKVTQFLSLISFRYVPNRVVPTEIIRKEQQALRDVLVRRLAKFKKQTDEVFRGLESTAESLVLTVSDDIKKFAPDIQKVRLATAASLADLAFQFGYKLEEGGVEMDENEQGSGMQSLLMFETLHLIDRDYFQQFGWKQAAVWAVEEPESSLNTALEARTAHFLSRVAKEQRGRLQIIGTTHSDLMIQYGGAGYFIEKTAVPGKGVESTATAKSPKDLVEHASRFGVSRWVNPVLLCPLEPLVLVEGKFDRDFLFHCFRALRISQPPRIACLEDLKNDASKGGVETLITFIKENADVIRARHSFAKVCVLLDGDSASKIASLSAIFKPVDPFVAMAWDVTEANPNCFFTQNCRGVERFYPDSVLSEAKAAKPDIFFSNPQGVTVVRKEESAALKKLSNDVVNKGLCESDVLHAKPLVERLLASVR